MRSADGPRKGRIVGWGLLLLSSAWTGRAFQEKAEVFNYLSAPKPPALEIVTLGGGLYLARGEWGGNVGFFVGDEGVFVIDSKATRKATRKVVEAIAKLTPMPITKVAFTHSDGDCFNGYDVYPKKAEIICSSRTANELVKGMLTLLEMDAPAENYAFEATAHAIPDFAPSLAFDGHVNLLFGSEPIELSQSGPAHTSGDVVISFPNRRTAFIGDLVFGRRDPLIQRPKGGYSFGLVTTLTILLNSKPEIETFIPSHSDSIGREELRLMVRSIEETQTRILNMVDAGRTMAEVKSAFRVAEPPREPGAWIWPRFPLTVFWELTERRIVPVDSERK